MTPCNHTYIIIDIHYYRIPPTWDLGHIQDSVSSLATNCSTDSTAVQSTHLLGLDSLHFSYLHNLPRFLGAPAESETWRFEGFEESKAQTASTISSRLGFSNGKRRKIGEMDGAWTKSARSFHGFIAFHNFMYTSQVIQDFVHHGMSWRTGFPSWKCTDLQVQLQQLNVGSYFFFRRPVYTRKLVEWNPYGLIIPGHM